MPATHRFVGVLVTLRATSAPWTYRLRAEQDLQALQQAQRDPAGFTAHVKNFPTAFAADRQQGAPAL